MQCDLGEIYLSSSAFPEIFCQDGEESNNRKSLIVIDDDISGDDLLQQKTWHERLDGCAEQEEDWS